MRSRVPKASKRVRDSSFPCLQTEVPRSVPCRLSGCWFNLYEPLLAQVSWFCGLSCSVLDLFISYNLFAPSFAEFPELRLMRDYGLQLFPSVAGWSLPDNNFTRHQSGHRREQVPDAYPLLLRVIAGAIFVDFAPGKKTWHKGISQRKLIFICKYLSIRDSFYGMDVDLCHFPSQCRDPSVPDLHIPGSCSRSLWLYCITSAGFTSLSFLLVLHTICGLHNPSAFSSTGFPDPRVITRGIWCRHSV